MQETKFIPEDKVREIRETCSIVDVIAEYVNLKKIGANYRGLCPFHNEKTPSFFVNEDKRLFNCFGCGVKGDVFTFLMKHENVTFQEAVKQLAKRVGIHLPYKPLSPEQRKRQSEREDLFSINELAATFYNSVLLHDKRAERARNYLNKRGITIKTIEEYCLGYAPDSWDALFKYLKSRQASLACAQKTGLIISRNNARQYDRFRNRILFPIINIGRKIVGFGGRIIDKGEPKYLNSPESSIYSKRHSLYGLDRASHYIRKQDKVIIVEGYLDLLTLHQEGINNVVAALGTALTEQQIQVLKRYTSNIITIFDSDPSGQKAMIRSLEPFLTNGLSPQVVLLPQGEDPDSYVQQHGTQAFRQQLESATLLLDFVIEKIIQKNDIATPRGKVNACDEIMPLLSNVADDMERDLYIQKVARRIGVKEMQVRTRTGMRSSARTIPSMQENKTENTGEPSKNAEQLIIKLMLNFPETIDSIEETGVVEEFADSDFKDLALLITRVYKQHREIHSAELLHVVEKENLRKIIAEDVFSDYALVNPFKILEDCVRNICLKKNTQRRQKVTYLLKQAEAEQDEYSSMKYQQEFQKLLQEKKQILQYKMNLHHI